MIGAIFGVSLIAAMPASFGMAVVTGEWRWLLVTAACALRLAFKQ